MICAYCKSRVMESDRRCQACGSMVFVAKEKIVIPMKQVEESPSPKSKDEALTPEMLDEAIRRMVYEKPPNSRKSRWIALVLCVIFGWLGIHRFYVGKIGTGVLFLFTFGFFGFGAIVDAITILFGHFRDREGFRLIS